MNSSQEPQRKVVYVAPRSEEHWENSTAAQALKRLQNNPRVRYIVISVPENACTTCQNLAGTYPKHLVPRLPIESCSYPLGCRAFYSPYLEDIFPYKHEFNQLSYE